MLKRSLFILSLLLLWAAIQVPAAFACSGYPYFGVENLPTMDLLVRATVLDTDDRGYNAVIRVEEYFKGEGPQLLTVMRYPVALSTGALVRGYDTDCLYAGRGHRWVRGSQGYFGLRPNGDGTFTDENGGTAHFYPVDGTITYEEGATEGYAVEFDDPLTISEAEFIDLMLEAGGRDQSVIPTAEYPLEYPLMRFLNITTENGTRYQVNPDRSVMQVPEDAPLAISMDGAHVAFAVNDEIAFQYIWTGYAYTDEAAEYREGDDPFATFWVPGQAVRFSNDSNFAAVWDQMQLGIYRFSNDGNILFSGYGLGLRISLVGTVDFSQTSESPQRAVLWSGDSTTIVWEDGGGIWRWDIFSEAAPQEVIAPEALSSYHSPQLLDVSTYGRYIRAGQERDWILVDSETHETYTNAVVAPTEQYLVFFGTDPRQELDLAGCPPPPLRNTCGVQLTNVPAPSFIFDYQENLLGLVSCQEESCRVTTLSWQPSIAMPGYMGGRSLGMNITDLRQGAFDPQYNQPALLVGDYRIYLEFYSDYDVENYLPYLDILDLEDVVDSPIASIEWGQMVFYDTYLLTTPEYIPR